VTVSSKIVSEESFVEVEQEKGDFVRKEEEEEFDEASIRPFDHTIREVSSWNSNSSKSSGTGNSSFFRRLDENGVFQPIPTRTAADFKKHLIQFSR